MYEGYLESQLMLQLLMDPKVKYFERAPKIKYGKGKRYTSDLYLEYVRGLVPAGHEYYILEVKPKKTLRKNREKFKKRFAEARKQCAEAEMHFRVLSEVEIMPRAEAVRAVARCKRVPVDLLLAEEIIAAVKTAPGITPEALKYAFPEQNNVLSHVWAMVYRSQLVVDLTQKPTNFTPLFIPPRDVWPVLW